MIQAPLAAGSLDVPPMNLEAEQRLLGQMLRGAVCPDFLGQQHFADPIHGLIHSAMERPRALGMKVTLASIVAHFERSGELAEVGGSAYLAQLYHALSPYKPGLAITPTEHARLIHDAWVLRMQCGEMSAPKPPPSAGAQETIQ